MRSTQPAASFRVDADAPSQATLLVLGAAALLLRWLAYTGFFGSDEVTYIDSAFKIVQGDWSVAEYVGANRYGVNLPMAGLAALLGRNEFAAATYSMLCSVAEVVLLAWMGARLVGARAAMIGAILLACLPLHLHFAGRIMADAPLSLAITASFLFFIDGEMRASRRSYFVAGAALGFAFWIKPATLFYAALFLVYPLLWRTWRWPWLWMVAGAATLLAANMALFAVLTGSPTYIFEVMRSRSASGYLEAGMARGSLADGPGVYLQYLFIKLYQTWLLGPLALAAVLLWLRARWRQDRDAATDRAMGWLLWWGPGLVLLMSLLVISLRPLIFVPKQTNYMLMFAAPLALLAGWALARLQGRRLAAALAVAALPGVALALLAQVSVQTFTANSRAAVDFARKHPQAIVYGSANAVRASQFDSLVHPQASPQLVLSIDALADPVTAREGVRRYAIFDAQAAEWANVERVRRAQDVPSCWHRLETLTPASASVPGRALRQVVEGWGAAPARLRAAVVPTPAWVFEVPAGCVLPAEAPRPRK